MLKLRKPTKVLQGTIELPASKSISNRLLIIRSLCKDDFAIENHSQSDDTLTMEKLLKKIHDHESEKRNDVLELDAKNAGTVFRFLTAYLASKPGTFILTGDERMKHRPVGELVNALKLLGADIEYIDKKDFPPIQIKGKKLSGGEVDINAGISSQFVSALLMIGPGLDDGLILHLKGSISSEPYIRMTTRLMEESGAGVKWDNNTISVSAKPYRPKQLIVESDWSSASYWYLLAVFSDEVNLVLKGLHKKSVQGDAVIADIFTHFGVQTEFFENGIRITKSKDLVEQFEYDFTDYPDLAQTLAVCCAGLNIPAKLTGLGSLKIKETDRLFALKTELLKLGNSVEISEDELSVLPSSKSMQPIVINTYNDHRMAMAFTPLAILYPELVIENPDVVKKSYPAFWDDMEKVGFETMFLTKPQSH